jgi:DnaJ domain
MLAQCGSERRSARPGATRLTIIGECSPPGPAVRRRHSGDPYEVLGIPRDADLHEIRAAYRRLAKQYHPDVNSSPDAAQHMSRINWAYRVAAEHARHEGPRVYRGGSHRQAGRSGRVRWYVRQRPPPQGGRLVVVTRSVELRGQRGESANVEGLVVVENHGTGPLEGEARATPAYVIVSPKQFSLDQGHSQMFRVSVPNRYCGPEASEVTLHFDTNGGEERVAVGLPAAADVLVALEPSRIELGELDPGEHREVRLRLSYRGNGLPKTSVAVDRPWLELRAISVPRRTQYFRLTVRAPEAPGPVQGTVRAQIGEASAVATVSATVRAPTPAGDDREGG